MGFETLVFLLAVLPRKRYFRPQDLEDRWVPLSGFPSALLLFQALDEFIAGKGKGIRKVKTGYWEGSYCWDGQFHQSALLHVMRNKELLGFYAGFSRLEREIFFLCWTVNTGGQDWFRFFLSQHRQERLINSLRTSKQELFEAVEDLFEKAEDAQILHLLGENNHIATNRLWSIRPKDYTALLLLNKAENCAWIKYYRDPRKKETYYDITQEPHERTGPRDFLLW